MESHTRQIPFGFSEEEKKYLLRLARYTLEQYFHLNTSPPPPINSDNIRKPYGVFVTLSKAGDLRGCVGYVDPVKPLDEAVKDMALSAALKDPRFVPLQANELPDVEIEISVLSPLKKIGSIEEIQVGVHGLVIQDKHQRGLLLPQVAVQYNWDVETFLTHTCLKAGLREDAWKSEEVEIYVFSAEIFSESDFWPEAISHKPSLS